MRTLRINKQENEFVIEHVNSFGHGTKRFFITENGLKEGLDAYAPVIGEYELEVSEELWGFVLNYVGSSNFQQKASRVENNCGMKAQRLLYVEGRL
ncbi:MAG: hypothetical protein E6778_18755 [Niallia nealsonii]|nr:hypothetical protein [Niallia nealsonii]